MTALPYPTAGQPEGQPLSNCHKAPVTIGGTGDFDDKDRVVTQHYVCSECKQPCDLYQPDSPAGDEHEDLHKLTGEWIEKNIDARLGFINWTDGHNSLTEFVAAYAERLATRRVVEELDNLTGPMLAETRNTIDERIKELTATLTKEQDNG